MLYEVITPEREVSLNSGKAVMDGLDKAGFHLVDGRVDHPWELLDRVRSERPDLVFIALHGQEDFGDLEAVRRRGGRRGGGIDVHRGILPARA